VNRRQSFIAYAQSPELVQQGDGALDHTSALAQIAAVHSSASGNLMHDAALLQRQAVNTTVIGTVGLDTLWLFQRLSLFAAHWRHAIDERQQLCDIMPVGPSQDDIDRDALRIDEEMVFPPLFAAIGWV
jgi:hypothetical protein